MIYNEDIDHGQLNNLWIRFLKWSDRTVAGMIAYVLFCSFLWGAGLTAGAFITVKIIRKLLLQECP